MWALCVISCRKFRVVVKEVHQLDLLRSLFFKYGKCTFIIVVIN